MAQHAVQAVPLLVVSAHHKAMGGGIPNNEQKKLASFESEYKQLEDSWYAEYRANGKSDRYMQIGNQMGNNQVARRQYMGKTTTALFNSLESLKGVTTTEKKTYDTVSALNVPQFQGKGPDGKEIYVHLDSRRRTHHYVASYGGEFYRGSDTAKGVYDFIKSKIKK